VTGLVRVPRAHRRTARTVAAWGLALYVAAAAAVLLAPVSPDALVRAATLYARDELGLSTIRQGWLEFGANVAMFVPVGALVTLLFSRAWIGVLAALAMSACAELAQILLPGRMASPRDVLANVAGAAIGAGCVALFRSGVRRAARRRSR
jgi:hypothetical protein